MVCPILVYKAFMTLIYNSFCIFFMPDARCYHLLPFTSINHSSLLFSPQSFLHHTLFDSPCISNLYLSLSPLPTHLLPMWSGLFCFCYLFFTFIFLALIPRISICIYIHNMFYFIFTPFDYIQSRLHIVIVYHFFHHVLLILVFVSSFMHIFMSVCFFPFIFHFVLREKCKSTLFYWKDCWWFINFCHNKAMIRVLFLLFLFKNTHH